MDENHEILTEAIQLMAGFKSVLMATRSEQGIPEASYAPYYQKDHDIYVFISGLAAHTRNIEHFPTLSVFFIENEMDAKNIFARRRLSFECCATEIDRATLEWSEIIQEMTTSLGSTMTLLKDLSDFKLMKITPQKGVFVKGFGAAYQISGPNLDQVSQIKN
ncbi:pyridoxamine 5'-phosphate oxidase-like FMN-binding protein [Oleiphilus messinensis]|uniref:Pyridoxamine 5'-phosphate oxidase-like FMN-binding protein n=1 Tax=Oleiphilus messinensis TaxID=141451 RepID=A0A1Y0I3R8_9GAMM|nr:pyridoxamine 5'-phosphate oxidase family protein [Oleiphilus messinensis]ARU55148.1 pyridoxamine 5'-phosphate oxidase-like FMN-binding protein [Oleiphilus messinensis]